MKVMGIYISVAYLGVVSGPLFGGFVIEQIHWRWVFYIPGLCFLVLAILGFGAISWERYGDRESRIRALDLSLYIGALMLLAFGIFDAQSSQGRTLLLSGVIAFIAFCWFQSKRRDPLLQVKLFTQSRTFTLLGLAHFLIYVSIFALPFTLTLYLQYLKGIDAQTTGFILLIQALCTASIAPLSGWLGERFRPRYLIFTGVSLFVVSCLMLAGLEQHSPVWIVVISIGIMGTSIGLMDTPIFHTSMATVDDKFLGSASATMNGLRTLGGFLGIGLISYLMGVHLGKSPIEPSRYPDLMRALEHFFTVAASLSILTLTMLIVGVLSKPKDASPKSDVPPESIR